MKKITIERKNAVIKGIESGLTVKEACIAAGISHLPLLDYKRFLQITDDAESDLYVDLRVYLNSFLFRSS